MGGVTTAWTRFDDLRKRTGQGEKVLWRALEALRAAGVVEVHVVPGAARHPQSGRPLVSWWRIADPQGVLEKVREGVATWVRNGQREDDLPSLVESVRVLTEGLPIDSARKALIQRELVAATGKSRHVLVSMAQK